MRQRMPSDLVRPAVQHNDRSGSARPDRVLSFSDFDACRARIAGYTCLWGRGRRRGTRLSCRSGAAIQLVTQYWGNTDGFTPERWLTRGVVGNMPQKRGRPALRRPMCRVSNRAALRRPADAAVAGVRKREARQSVKYSDFGVNLPQMPTKAAVDGRKTKAPAHRS